MMRGANGDGICAIFTAFRPSAELISNIEAVRSQVQYLVVVDDGSPPHFLLPIALLAQSLDFCLIANSRNLGIAAALNIGAQWACQHGSEFLLFFDQDSTATPGMVEELARFYHSQENVRSIGIVGTTNRERLSGLWPPPLVGPDGEFILAMTSGSFMPVSAYEACGPFNEELFIEFVDHEYCLRLRSAGYRIMLCSSAALIHDVGFPRYHSILGYFRCRTIHHSAGRRYYFVRNLLVVLLRYGRREPQWARIELAALAKSTAKIVLFEEHRTRKVFMSLKGIADALIGRMGKRIEL